MVSGWPGLRRGTACSTSGWLRSQTRAPPSRSPPKPNVPSVSTFWSPDSKTILFLNDSGGDENFLLYGVDIATGAQKALTPFEKTRALVVGISRVVKDRILVGLNNRDPRWHDVYSLDLATGKLTLVLQNDGGYAGYTADEQLVPRIAQKSTDDGGSQFFRILNGKIEDSAFATVGLEDSQTTGPLGFTTDGKTLYWVDSRGRDTAALVGQDVASGGQTTIAEDPRADIGDTLSDPTDRRRAGMVGRLPPHRMAVERSGHQERARRGSKRN